jgi:creatinine amidohydrolase
MKMAKEVWLQNLTWEDIEARIKGGVRTVIVPVGSTEQHGPHLPVGTDTMVAITLAEAAARRGGALVAPPLWYGWSPHHMVLPGTITIRPEVLIEIVYDVITSLNRHGFDRFVLLNGHRVVNIAWLQIAAERAKRELGIKAVIFDPAYMSKEIVQSLGWGELGHSDEIESSHMWHAYPDLVRMERAKDNPHPRRDLYHVDPGFCGDTLCYVPSSPEEARASAGMAGGTTGEPTKASREGGRVYHEHLVNRLAAVVAMLQG